MTEKERKERIKLLEETIKQLEWYLANEYWNPTLVLSHAGNVADLDKAKAELAALNS